MKPGLLPMMLLRESYEVAAFRQIVRPGGKTMTKIGPVGKTVSEGEFGGVLIVVPPSV